MIGHILARAALHIFSSVTVYLLVFFALNFALHRATKMTLQILPALLAVGFIGWREAYDVAHGQPLLKAYTDYASWIIGMSLAVWGLRRYIKELRSGN